jgi:LEA14-like dessication related protein
LSREASLDLAPEACVVDLPAMKKLLLLLPLCLGCALLRSALSSSFEKPTLVFRDARLSSVDFEGAEVDLVFLVNNPNSMGLDLAKADYLLQVEGKQVVAGAPQNGLAIPARGSAEVTFPARVKWAEIVPALEALFAQEVVHYRASGQLGVNTPIGVVTLPLEHEGTFASPRLPKFDVGPARIVSVSLIGARLSVPLLVSNPNSFPLPVAGLLGELSIAGASVGRIALPEQAPVPAGQQLTLALPVEVNFLSAGAAAAQAIRAGVAEVKVDATLNAGGITLPFRVAKTVELQRTTGAAGP